MPTVLSIDSLTGSGRAYSVFVPNSVQVTAKYNAVSSTTSVVVFPSVSQIKLVIPSSVVVDRVVAPTAIIFDPQLVPYTQAPAAWSIRFESANPGIVRTNADGTVTALAPGTSRITVDVHGKRDSADVTVVPKYAVTLLPGTDSLGVVDVNDSGDVVALRGYEAQSYLIRGSQKTDLGLCLVRGINNRGQVACSTSVYENGVFTELFGTGAFYGKGSGIDESGAVFGMLMPPDSLAYRAFLWRGGTVDVYPSQGLNFYLMSTGRIAGGSSGLGQKNDLYPQPVLLRPTSPTFPKNPGVRGTAAALDINDSENVVGSSWASFGGGSTAVIWLKSQGYQGQFLDPRSIAATAISESNDVVGSGKDGVFVWKNGDYVVLSDAVSERGWTFTGSPAISRSGTIAVYGTHLDGRKGIVLIKLR
jgi:hypothetical protein